LQFHWHILIGFFLFFIFILTPGRIYETNNLTWLVAPERSFLGRFIFEHLLAIFIRFSFQFKQITSRNLKTCRCHLAIGCTSLTNAIRSVDGSRHRFTFAKPRSAPGDSMDARSSVAMRADPGTPRPPACDMHAARDQRRRPVVRLSARHRPAALKNSARQQHLLQLICPQIPNRRRAT
jgi:hypothetical protein